MSGSPIQIGALGTGGLTMSLYHRTMGHLIAIVDAIGATLKDQPIPDGEGDNIVQDILRSNAFREWVRQFAAARVEGWIKDNMMTEAQAAATLKIGEGFVTQLLAGIVRLYHDPEGNVWLRRSDVLAFPPHAIASLRGETANIFEADDLPAI